MSAAQQHHQHWDQSTNRPGPRRVGPVAPIAFALVAATALVLQVPAMAGPMVLAGDGVASPLVLSENASIYRDWSMDEDDNGLDDRLDEDLARGATGTVLLHVHYERRPTELDAAGLRELHGASRTYVFDNWDDIQVETTYDRVTELVDAPGVIAVERYDVGHAELVRAPKALRVQEAAGVPVVDGIDHSLGVHEDLGLRGEGMVVAVLDTGVDNTHFFLDDLDDDLNTNDPKLLTKLDPLTGRTIVAGASVENGFVPIGCIDPQDDAGHGTHVASIATGTGRSDGRYAGMAPQARLVDVDISPGGAGLGTALGLDWIISFNKGTTCFGDPGDDAIDVANLSFSVGTQDPSASINRKLTDVARAGITIVVSAGNSGPGDATLTKGGEGVIFTAAVAMGGSIARNDDFVDDYSSRGPRMADGDADTLDELRPDVGAPGTSIAAAERYSVDGVTALTGTSMAAPMVTGIAALVLQANPSLRPVDLGSNEAMGDVGAVPVRDVLQQTAQYSTLELGGTLQTATGKFGLPWNNAFGYGYVDAYAAVTFAQSLASP